MVNKINMVLAFMEIPVGVYWRGYVGGVRKQIHKKGKI